MPNELIGRVSNVQRTTFPANIERLRKLAMACAFGAYEMEDAAE
jgi:hypothetical protein